MDVALLDSILPRSKTKAFEEFLQRTQNCWAEYAHLKTQTLEAEKMLRAKREGISIAQIEEESRRVAAPFALRPDEKQELDNRQAKLLELSDTDEKLFHKIIISASLELKHQRFVLSWKGLPVENRPYCESRVNFMEAEIERMIDFARLQGWQVPQLPSLRARP